MGSCRVGVACLCLTGLLRCDARQCAGIFRKVAPGVSRGGQQIENVTRQKDTNPMALSKDQVMQALGKVSYPGLSRDIVSFGMVKGVELLPEAIVVSLVVSSSDPTIGQKLEHGVREGLQQLSPGRIDVNVELRAASGPAAGGHGTAQAMLMGNARHVIAVASGKGGVGKSAVSSNLAVAFARQGLRTGILDADIYGPSIQLILGDHQQPVVRDDKIIPIVRHGVSMMSIGFLVDEDNAMIWRGPMVMNALVQLMSDVAWPELDVLVVDMPPGTGDVQLTMSQRVALSGAVVVTTPQEVALIDARKAINMFGKVNVPILGIIENMSWFIPEGSAQKQYIFGNGGGRREAERQGVDLLAEIPLDQRIRQCCDAGTPVVLEEPGYGEIFDQIVSQLRARLQL
ncbi:MAG: Mrp/NBP35 family ATP-binding protein [Calditrichaeota bacterium]|nr:Mrp/NBP35 family ATP-binding protein [Calditrichota bacterium]